MMPNLGETNDLELMELLKKGRQDAFVEIVHRHQRPLLNFFRKMGASMNEAENMAQETFLRLFDYRFRYRPLAKFTTFLYTLARHARADRLRKMKREPAVGPLAEQPDERGRFESASQVNVKMDVQAALDRLSEKLRAVVVMNFYQGLKYQEISDALDVPVGTVKSRMFHAMQQLKEVLDVEGSGG